MSFTYEEIVALPAGRELDARIEELVYGAKVTRDWPCMVNGDDGSMMPYFVNGGSPRVYYQERHPTTGRGWDRRVVPHYSTDMGAAWPVVEKRRLAGQPLVISAQEDGYQVAFRAQTRFLSGDENAAATICRAVLLDLLDL